MKPEKRKELETMKQQCFTTAFNNKNLDDYFDRPNIMNDPIPSKILKENSLGNLNNVPVTKIPLYIFHSQHDQISSLENVKNLVNQWCSEGAMIEFVIDEVSDHQILALTGASSAISFFIDRFHQIPLPSSLSNRQCTQYTTISSLLSPKALGIFGTQLLDALTALLNLPIGP